jgi:hypothetical protein
MLTCKYPTSDKERANKIIVNTTVSRDGRNTESFCLEYDPEQIYSLFLLTEVLDKSITVHSYRIHDEDGKRLKGNPAHPKMV